MSENQDQPLNQTDEAEVKNALPSLEEFEKLSTEEKERILTDYQNQPVKEEVESTTNEEVSEETTSEETPKEESPKAEEPAKEITPEPKKDNQDLLEELNTLKKSYKELQGAYTRERQQAKAREKSTSDSQSNDAHKATEEISELVKLANGDKDAEKFLSKLDEVITKKAEKIAAEKLKPIEQQFSERAQTENISKFNKEVDDFLKSPLSELTEQLNQIIAENHESNEDMLEAAKHNPNLFREYLKELKDRHTDKLVEILGKAKSTSPNPLERNKQINQTGVSRSSKTTTTVTKDMSDPEFFKSRPLVEQEKYLREKGLLKY